MKTYAIGYYNKPWSKTDFVVLAETKSEGVAEFIERSYNEAYTRNHMTIRAVTKVKKDLESYRYAD